MGALRAHPGLSGAADARFRTPAPRRPQAGCPAPLPFAEEATAYDNVVVVPLAAAVGTRAAEGLDLDEPS